MLMFLLLLNFHAILNSQEAVMEILLERLEIRGEQ
jgi:hypothetical protein